MQARSPAVSVHVFHKPEIVFMVPCTSTVFQDGDNNRLVEIRLRKLLTLVQ